MDLTLLTDPTRCPDCAGVLPAAWPEPPASCPTCALPLQGPLVERLWRLSLQAADTLGQRQRVLSALRERALAPVGVEHPGWGGVRGDGPAARGAAPGFAPADPWVPGPRQRERDKVTPRQVQRLLLGLGVLLLAVAALIFTVVAWGRIGIGGRTAILGALTAGAAAGARLAYRRELPGTAEALAVLTLALLGLDAYGVRANDLAGTAAAADDAYWSGVVGVLAVLAAAAHRVLPLRTLRYTAAVALQLPLLILGDRLGEVALTVAVLAQGTALLAVVRRGPGVGVALLLGAGGGSAYAIAAANAAVLTYDGDPSGARLGAGAGSALLLVVAATAALLTWRHRALESVPQLGSGAAAAALLGAAHAPMFRAFTSDNTATAGAGLLLLAAAAVGALPQLPRRWIQGPLAVVAGGGLLTLLAVADPIARAVGGPLHWVADPWSQDTDGSARARLGGTWPHHGTVALTLALLTATAALLAWRLRATPAGTVGGLAGVALATGTTIVLPVATNIPYLLAVLGLVATGGALLAVAVRFAPSFAGAAETFTAQAWHDVDAAAEAQLARTRRIAGSVALAAAGTALAGLGLAWSLAARPATPLAIGLALLAALVARAVAVPDLRPVATCLAASAVVAETGVLTRIADQGAAQAGTAAVVAAAILAVAARLVPDARERVALERVALAAGCLAFLPVTTSAHWSSIALLAAGTALAVLALSPQWRALGWVAGAVLSTSGWIRLALAEVETPEAYSTGPALALLVVGFLARRGDRELSSWRAYGAGLTTALLPSLALSLNGDDLTRPLLLGLAALVVLLAGVRSRLQAPLVLGGAVLALDALIQLAPYADAVPRWASVGAAGLLLLVLGVTFERRLRDLRRLAAGLAGLG